MNKVKESNKMNKSEEIEKNVIFFLWGANHNSPPILQL